jgi:3-phosphoshikimate 1-carboxyvinyltransferase
VTALQHELAKVGASFGQMPDPAFFEVKGKANWTTAPQFATYGDHRMAMAFAPLAMFAPVYVENPAVVAKSYPAYWEHLRATGFEMV